MGQSRQSAVRQFLYMYHSRFALIHVVFLKENHTPVCTQKQILTTKSHNMGEHTGRRVVNVLLRFFQLCSAVIVVGIIGWALHRIHDGNGSANGRLVYTEVVAALSIVASIVLMPPLRYVFKAWFVDLIL